MYNARAMARVFTLLLERAPSIFSTGTILDGFRSWLWHLPHVERNTLTSSCSSLGTDGLHVSLSRGPYVAFVHLLCWGCVWTPRRLRTFQKGHRCAFLASAKFSPSCIWRPRMDYSRLFPPPSCSSSCGLYVPRGPAVSSSSSSSPSPWLWRCISSIGLVGPTRRLLLSL